MITIYAPEAQDFSTLGLGALAPYECVIEEQAGGMYELTMTHPMDAEGKWLSIGVGCIVKAPAPVRETPLVESEIVGEGEATEPVTVTRKIYKVQTNTGANLHLRQGPSTSTAILSKYRPGTEVVVLSQASGWGQVIVCSSGATGYMSMQYLVYVRDETETIEGDAPGPERVVYPVQSRMQLFRIFKVERDAAEREVRVEARHIFYDLLGNVVKNEYAPEGEAADAVVEELFARALNAHDFSVHCQTARSVTGEYTRRGLVECLLDPDDGVLPQTGARLVRDNFDVWLLPDATRETGVTIRHGKNLLGATLTTDWDSLVTRIIPVGQDKEGKALLLEGTTYMDSPHISDYPVICAQAVEYDVKIGQEGIDNAAQARAKLQELAEADFSDNGVDLPTVGLDVDFVALGETEEYRAYADLEAVHLYDTVRVIAKSAGIDAAVRVTGYKWDALGRKYEAVTLGEIADLKTTVYGYELQRGSVKTVKIAPGAVGSAQLRELAVQYAHINTAAVEQLSANSITALKAYITEIVAGSVTTDELYAGIAAIALAQITTANIENANIDWAQIGTLSADIAAIAKAHLTDADIDWANIANLTAAVAEIAEAKIAGATIGSAQIDDLEAVVAEIIHAQVATGEFDFAEVENFLGSVFILGQGIAGTVSIENLMVTRANMLNATVQTLILPGTDGKYYQITVGTDGQLSTEEVTVTDSEIAAGETEDGRQIVATTINAETINGSTVTAQQAVLNTVLTQALTAGKITAGEALIASASIPTLYVTSVEALGNSMTFSANEQIQMIVGNVQQAQETADNAQEAAEQAAPYISATPPEEAPEAGKLWLDEGVEPSVLRKWRGADVTTEREYAQTVAGDADSPAVMLLDNSAGQVQRVAVTAACRAGQAGTGEPSPENIRAITGRDSVDIAACGKNLYDVNDRKTFSDGVTVDADGWITVTADNSGGNNTLFRNIFTRPSAALKPDREYTIVCEIASTSISVDNANLCLVNGTVSQFVTTKWLANLNAGTQVYVVKTKADFSDCESMLRTYVQYNAGVSGTIKFRISVLEDTSITAETFEYEPYRSMGGGTVTPTEPLYGLPGAEDTVEVSVDGDVLVTRRTNALVLDGTENWTLSENTSAGAHRFNMPNVTPAPKLTGNNALAQAYLCSHYAFLSADATWSGNRGVSFASTAANLQVCDMDYADVPAWKAYLAAQYAAGTPVTVVYELAAPETEALTAISPIAPVPGQLNLTTDADALTATIRGSGWETVNDTNDIRAALADVDSDVAGLIAGMGLLEGTVAQLGEQIITPEGVVSIVAASDGYQALVNMASQSAEDFELVRKTVSNLNGRVETLEEGVHVKGSNVGLYSSGSPFRMDIDHTGIGITENGQPTITVRESRADIPRITTQTLIMGGFAYRAGENDLYQMIV